MSPLNIILKSFEIIVLLATCHIKFHEFSMSLRQRRLPSSGRCHIWYKRDGVCKQAIRHHARMHSSYWYPIYPIYRLKRETQLKSPLGKSLDLLLAEFINSIRGVLKCFISDFMEVKFFFQQSNLLPAEFIIYFQGC